jgi:hypothetical protein
VPGTAQHWLAAVDMAVNPPCPEGGRGKGLSWLSDHGCPPPAGACMDACGSLESHPALTSDHHPQGHAAPARLMRPLKAADLWRQEWTWPLALLNGFGPGVAYDNEHSLQSSLGDNTPNPCERDDDRSHSPPFLAA